MLDNRAFETHLASFMDGAHVFVTVDTARPTRSNNQNRYYWGVVLKLIEQHTGHSRKELHEIYKRMFLPPQIIHYMGKDIKLPASSAESDTLEFSTFVDRVRAEAATMGIDIPNPDQVQF